MKSYYVANPCDPTKDQFCGEQILIIIADHFNDIELFYPYYRFIEAGYPVTITAPNSGEITGKYSVKFPVEIPLDQIKPEEYDLLYIPGGGAPDILRKNAEVLKLVNWFNDHNKPIVSICHGPLVLADAGILSQKNITCWPSIKEEILSVGGIYTDQIVVRDDHLITSRWPGDMPVFMKEVFQILRE